jgi:hypothetical protein
MPPEAVARAAREEVVFDALLACFDKVAIMDNDDSVMETDNSKAGDVEMVTQEDSTDALFLKNLQQCRRRLC